MLTAGYTQACTANAGGVRRVALANRQDVSTWVVDGTGAVTGITMVATKKFYEFEAGHVKSCLNMGDIVTGKHMQVEREREQS